MILSLFATSVVLAFGALFHSVGQFLNIFIVTIAGINVEVALSFFVCNLLVVVTYAYRVLHRDRDGAGTITEDTSTSDDDFTTRRTRGAQTTRFCLTTVDLAVPTDYQTIKMTVRGPTEDLSLCS